MSQMVYVVRHCQATGQEPNAPLTELGEQQALALVKWLCDIKIERIVSSPFVRAYQSIVPLAEHLGLPIETDERLTERVLSPTPLDDWRQQLAETFQDLDLCFEGGESSRTAMLRGVAVVSELLHQTSSSVVVTHGNLMTLILKHFDQQIGYTEWEQLGNPDVYYVRVLDREVCMNRLSKPLSNPVIPDSAL